jgi:hypothetical protein
LALPRPANPVPNPYPHWGCSGAAEYFQCAPVAAGRVRASRYQEPLQPRRSVARDGFRRAGDLLRESGINERFKEL